MNKRTAVLTAGICLAACLSACGSAANETETSSEIVVETTAETTSEAVTTAEAASQTTTETTSEETAQTEPLTTAEPKSFTTLEELREFFTAEEITDPSVYCGWFEGSVEGVGYGTYHIYEEGGELHFTLYPSEMYEASDSLEKEGLITQCQFDDNVFLDTGDNIIAAANTAYGCSGLYLVNGKVYMSVPAAGDSSHVDKVNADGSYESEGTGVMPEAVNDTLIYTTPVMEAVEAQPIS